MLGNYTLLLIDSVNALYFTLVDLVSFDLKFLEDPARLNLLGVMLAFTLGSICGLLVLSKALRWFLQHYPEKIIALLIGFILGSLNATWPWKRAVYNPVKGKQIDSYELFWPKLTELENKVNLALRDLYIAKYGEKDGVNVSYGRVWIGMTEEMLRDSWGKPDKIEKNVENWGTFTQWYYGDVTYFFRDGILTEGEEKE